MYVTCYKRKFLTKMQTITEVLLKKGLEDKILRISDLKNIVGGSDPRIYGLLNKAIAADGNMDLEKRVIYY